MCQLFVFQMVKNQKLAIYVLALDIAPQVRINWFKGFLVTSLLIKILSNRYLGVRYTKTCLFVAAKQSFVRPLSYDLLYSLKI